MLNPNPKFRSCPEACAQARKVHKDLVPPALGPNFCAHECSQKLPFSEILKLLRNLAKQGMISHFPIYLVAWASPASSVHTDQEAGLAQLTGDQR